MLLALLVLLARVVMLASAEARSSWTRRLACLCSAELVVSECRCAEAAAVALCLLRVAAATVYALHLATRLLAAAAYVWHLALVMAAAAAL